MGKMFLNTRGFTALTKSVIDWDARDKLVAESVGKPVSKQDDAFFVDGKRLFSLNGKDCALCNVYAKNVCAGCPLRINRSQYTTLYKKVVANLEGDAAKGTLSIATSKAVTDWKMYLYNTRKEYTDDKNEISTPKHFVQPKQTQMQGERDNSPTKG